MQIIQTRPGVAHYCEGTVKISENKESRKEKSVTIGPQ